MHAMRPLGFILAVVFACSVGVHAAPPAFSADWAFGDANGSVFSLARHNDRLFIAGNFTQIGGIDASCIVEWDGKQFHALGAGISSSNTSTRAVRAMATFNDQLIVAGNFTSAGGADANSIAAWDTVTRTWTTLGAGLTQSGGQPADVRALKVASVGAGAMKVYAGGFFDRAGGGVCLNVAGWNGVTWDDAGGGYNGTINALEFFNDRLWAGGSGTSANRFRFWDGVNPWATVPNAALGGSSPRINDLEVMDGLLVIGGRFTTLGASTTSPNICRFDATTCTGLGTGCPFEVSAIAERDVGESDRVLAAMQTSANSVVEFDLDLGANWIPAGVRQLGVSSTLLSLPLGAQVIAGGTTLQTLTTEGAWVPFGGAGVSGQFATVTDVVASERPGEGGQTAVVTGLFTVRPSDPDDPVCENVVEFDEVPERDPFGHEFIRRVPRWGVGLNAQGRSVQPTPTGLAFTGNFTLAGGTAARGLAFYEFATNSWSSPIPALNYVGTIEWYQDFTETDGPNARYFGGAISSPTFENMARLNADNSVSDLPCRPNGGVRGIRRRPGGGYNRFGFFTANSCGPTSAYYETTNSFDAAPAPYTLPTVDGEVTGDCEVFLESAAAGTYIGGAFTMAGTTVLNRVARSENGGPWQPLGAGVDGPVAALCDWEDGEGNNLYVVGSFLNAGGQPARRIARWNGSSWSPVLGPDGVNGLNGPATSLAIVDFGNEVGPTLVIGGSFTTAGGLSSGRIAQLVARGSPVIARQPPAEVRVALGTEAIISLRAHRSPPLTYQWRRNGQPLGNAGRVSGADSPALRIAATQLGDEGQYDCLVTNSFGSVGSSIADFLFSLVPCPEDFNRDGVIDPDDLSDYITCYFSPVPCSEADFNFDGTRDPDDLADYIAAFFGVDPPC